MFGRYARHAQCVLTLYSVGIGRQGTQVFAGKHGFITLRDLFRWAERRPNGYQQLAEEGYMLLAERLRKPEEKRVIKEVLEKNMKNVVINEDEIYSRSFKADSLENDLFESLRMAEGFGSMVWNQSMRRYVPVLLGFSPVFVSP